MCCVMSQLLKAPGFMFFLFSDPQAAQSQVSQPQQEGQEPKVKLIVTLLFSRPR